MHDFSPVATDYAKYRPAYPESLFERLQAHGIGLPGQQVLDMATGTGMVARRFAHMGCHVTGIDIAPALIEQARHLDREAGVQIAYAVGRAEDLDFPADTFAVVTAAQCWHFFDPTTVLTQVKRVLQPGGALTIIYNIWDADPANRITALTKALIQQYNPGWTIPGQACLFPDYLQQLATAGLRNLETFSFDANLEFSHDQWRGRIRASRGIGASLPADQITACDAELKSILARNFPQEPLVIPHRISAIIGRK